MTLAHAYPPARMSSPLLDPDASDASVEGDVLAGDVASFERLMRRYNALVFRTARAVVRDDAAAEDCAQQAWILAYDRLAQLHEPTGFPAWVARIAYRQALRVARVDRTRAQVSYDDLEGEPEMTMSSLRADPERAAQQSELRSQLEASIDQLPAALREAFVLCEVQQLSARETGDLLGITEQNARVRAHRARAVLRDRLGSVTPELAFAFDGARCDRMVAGVMHVVRSR